MNTRERNHKSGGNHDREEPRAAELTPVGMTPEDAENPVEQAKRRVNPVRAAIWTDKWHFLTVASYGRES